MASKTFIFFAACVCLVGCKQSTMKNDVPALLIAPDNSTIAEIRSIVSESIGSDSIWVAPDAFTLSSGINLEHPPVRDSQGNRIMGRDLGKPVQFRLVMHGKDCVLTRPETDERWVLNTKDCKAENS